MGFFAIDGQLPLVLNHIPSAVRTLTQRPLLHLYSPSVYALSTLGVGVSEPRWRDFRYRAQPSRHTQSDLAFSCCICPALGTSSSKPIMVSKLLHLGIFAGSFLKEYGQLLEKNSWHVLSIISMSVYLSASDFSPRFRDRLKWRESR